MGLVKSNLITLIVIILCIGAWPLYSYEIYSGKKVGPVYMGMALGDAFRELKNPACKELKGKKSHNFFARVLQLPEAGILYYSSIFYCSELHMVLLTDRGKVMALAVTAEKGMLEGVIDVKRGIEPVLVFYGKDGLTVVKRNTHRVYIYKQRGIMFFDDNGNGSIDMIIIWKE